MQSHFMSKARGLHKRSQFVNFRSLHWESEVCTTPTLCDMGFPKSMYETKNELKFKGIIKTALKFENELSKVIDSNSLSIQMKRIFFKFNT